MLIFHDPACESYQTMGHPESPARTRRTRELLRERYANDSAWEWRKPRAADIEQVRRAHHDAHIERLDEPHDFDGDTAYHVGIRERALESAGAAIGVGLEALAGHRAFSLMRPPGHHACRNRIMGFCYINSVAVAAYEALAQPSIERVAIFDFDAHHGNGTEDIVRGVEGILFASAHQYPGYPGTGTRSEGNIHNRIVPPGEHRAEHMEKLAELWEIVLEYQPNLILISAGFDAYSGDPITEMSLEREDFSAFGQWARQAEDSGVPVAAVLEGGYSRELPELIAAFLAAWEQKP